MTAVVALSVTALVGCGGGSSGDEAGAGSQQRTVTTVQVGSTVPTSPPSTGLAPGARPLSMEQDHPNGSVLRVKGVSFADTSVSVSIEAVNGFTKEVMLNRFGIHLRDDVGNRYGYIKPEQNPDLQIAPGATLAKTISFKGPVEDQATRLRLMTNIFPYLEAVDFAERRADDISPEFEIDGIPPR